MTGVVVVAGCLLLSWLGTGAARRHALSSGLIDRPGERSSHRRPTPSGGGLGPVVAILCTTIACAAAGWLALRMAAALLLAMAGMGVLGYLDDRRGLSARIRLAVQTLVAVAVLALLGGLEELQFGGWSLPGGWLLDAVTVLALVWLTNLYNFMDGIDGLAACEGIFVTGLVALTTWGTGVGLAAALLCAALIGFLPWNLPRARIFMGDVGSAAVGMGLGVIALSSAREGLWSPWAFCLLLGVFTVDATATLVWRFIKGDQWYTAHREHAYQRIAAAGVSHLRVTLGAMAVNALFIVPLLYWARGRPTEELMALTIGTTGLLAVWAWTRTMNDRRSEV